MRDTTYPDTPEYEEVLDVFKKLTLIDIKKTVDIVRHYHKKYSYTSRRCCLLSIMQRLDLLKFQIECVAGYKEFTGTVTIDNSYYDLIIESIKRELDSLFDEAEKIVKDEPALLRRVQRARLPLMYRKISGEYINLGIGDDHDPNLSYEELGKLISRFEEIARREGVTRVCEVDKKDMGSLDRWLNSLKGWYAKQKQ